MICFENESIHSYLLRRLMCFGEFTAESTRGIVSSLGVMPANPKILTRHIGYFRFPASASAAVGIERDLEAPFLEENLEKHGMYVRLNRARFHAYTCDSVFSGSTQLRFCVECLKERIEVDGVAWLDDEWTYHEHCRVHDTLLHEARSYRCNCEKVGMVSRLRSVFSGFCIECGSDIYGLEAYPTRDSNKHPYYPSTYWFHDIVYQDGDDWIGIDGKKPALFSPNL
jgi:hypothetical protein